jgi:hypothetical protein
VAAAALVCSASTATLAGTVNHGTFTGTKVSYHDITESGADIPPSLFVPKTPTVTDTPVSQLTFLPEQFLQTDQSASFDLKTKSSLLSIGVAGLQNEGVSFALNGLKLNIAGTYSLLAPFPTSFAQVSQAASYTVQVTGVNWQPFSGGASVNGMITITPASYQLTGPQAGYSNGNWSGSSLIDWDAVRTAAGVSNSDHITDIRIQLTADVSAAGLYGYARTSLTNFSVENPTAPVAVPEPPTIILAGLGAVAVVANGFRRKKQRQPMATGLLLNQADEAGAIALTA